MRRVGAAFERDERGLRERDAFGDVGHRDVDRRGHDGVVVGHADLDLVDVVAVGIVRRLEIGRRQETEMAGESIDLKPVAVGAAGDEVGHPLAFGIERFEHADVVAVLVQLPLRLADERRGLVDVGDGDRERLRVGEGAVAGRDRDFVDVVVVGIGRRLVIGRGDESERAGLRIDREQRGVGAAGDGVERGVAFGVGRHDSSHRGGILGHRDRGGRAAAVRGDRGRFVGIGEGDRQGLGVEQRAVAGGHHDLVDVVPVRIGRRFEIRRGGEGECAGHRIYGEQRRIRAAGDGALRGLPSGSVEVTVVTAVAFSTTASDAVAPPPFEVIIGASSTLPTVIVCV